jgi:hypothetical protein
MGFRGDRYDNAVAKSFYNPRAGTPPWACSCRSRYAERHSLEQLSDDDND